MTDADERDLDELWQRVHAVVREAREGGFDEEPPARIDAMLMAAARQRARPPKPSLWARVASWFAPVFAHPALASAATLVVVGGAAGVMYMRGQHHVVEPHAPHVQQVERPTEGAETGGRIEAETRPDPVTLPPSTGTVADPPVTPSLPPSDSEPAIHVPSERREAHGHAPEHQAPGGGGEKEPAPPPPPPPPDVHDPSGETEAFDDSDEATGALDGRKNQLATDKPADLPPGYRFEGHISTGGIPMQMAGSGDALEETAANRGTDPQVAPTTPTPSDQGVKPKDRAQSEQLTKQARNAARQRNCGAVKVMARRVKSIDKTYYKDTFTRDDAIKTCL